MPVGTRLKGVYHVLDAYRLDDLLENFQAANIELRALRVQLSELLQQLAAKDAENASLKEKLKLSRKNLYGMRSQRACSDNLLSYLALTRLVLDTLLYRESYRILDEKMRVSRMTLTNWLTKSSVFIGKLVNVLKEKCLEKDFVVNCDETWYRVKVEAPIANVTSAVLPMPSSNMPLNKAMTRMPYTSLVAWVIFMAWNVSMKNVHCYRNRFWCAVRV